MKNFTWKTFVVIAIILIGASVAYSKYAGSKANEGIVFESHIKGNAESGVVLTEYSDFQCPACGQFYPVVKALVEEYEDQMAMEYKHFPLISIHPFAVPAAKAAEAAGQQGKFFEMHDMLFENQSTWSNSATPQAYFVEYAQALGLDVDLFKTHMKASLIQDKIESEFNEARDAGLTGTPSFFLNGERLEFESFDEFIGKIESAIGVAPETTEEDSVQAESEIQFGI